VTQASASDAITAVFNIRDVFLLVFAVYARAVARDKTGTVAQVGNVSLRNGEHGDMVGNALFESSKPLCGVGRRLQRFFNASHALGKKINAAANPSESDHKSDKQNARIEQRSHSYRWIKGHSCIS
jgi:hypothetical protein